MPKAIPVPEVILVGTLQTALMFGISRPTLDQLTKQGIIPRHAPGQYDMLKAVPAMLAYKGQQAEKIQAKPAREFSEQRAELYKVRVERERMQLRQDQGDLLEYGELLTGLQNAFSVFRARILGIGSKLAPHLRLITSAEKIRSLIDDEHHRALSELATATADVVEVPGAKPNRGAAADGLDDDADAAADTDDFPMGRSEPRAESRVVG
jgi:hypothetical protein